MKLFDKPKTFFIETLDQRNLLACVETLPCQSCESLTGSDDYDTYKLQANCWKSCTDESKNKIEIIRSENEKEEEMLANLFDNYELNKDIIDDLRDELDEKRRHLEHLRDEAREYANLVKASRELDRMITDLPPEDRAVFNHFWKHQLIK